MILVSAPLSPSSLGWLRTQVSLPVVTSKLNAASEEQWSQTQILVVRTDTSVTADTLRKLPQLKLIVTATSGFDHIDLNATQAHNITVAHCPNANAISAAEQTLHLILATLKNAHQCHQALSKNLWRHHLPFSAELTKKHIGLIGFGRVARRLTKMLQGFDVHIASYDPYIDPQEIKDHGVTPMGRTEVFRWADILSLHLPLTRKTKQMINRSTLEQMNSDTILINCSRGEILNEDDVVQWLQSGELKAIGLDVFSVEPLPEKSSLRAMPQAYLTPHLGGYTEEARQRASQEAAETIVDFLNEIPLNATLPPESGWAQDL